MKKVCSVVLAVLALLLPGCNRVRTVSIEIVATADVHGNIFPYDFSQERGTAIVGSLSRVSTWLKQERRSYGDRLLYVDAGDMLQGSPLMYFERTAWYEKSSVASEVFDELGCDVLTLGNHDIEAGIPTLERFLSSGHFVPVCANVYYEGTRATYLKPYEVFDIDGVRIAVIGMTTPYVMSKIPPSQLSDFEFKGIEEESAELIPYIKEHERPHLIVGLFHSGLEEDQAVNDVFVVNEVMRTVSRVSGYDIVVYGHDHLPFCGKVADCNGDSVLLINPGPYAEMVAKVKLEVSISGDSLLGVNVAGSLEDMSAVEPDDAISAAHMDVIEAAWSYQDSVAGRFGFGLDGQEAVCGPSALTDYLNYVERRSENCEITIASPYSDDLLIKAGEVRMRDLQSLLPYENNMSVSMLKGSEVVRILEYFSGRWMNTIRYAGDTLLNIVPDGKGNFVLKNRVFDFMTASGIDYTVDVTKPVGQRIRVSGMSDGRPFDPEKLYRVGLSSFLASGGYQPFLEAVGLSGNLLRRRELYSSGADMRFHVATSLALNAERGDAIAIERGSNWRLVPERLASQALEHDRKILGYR